MPRDLEVMIAPYADRDAEAISELLRNVPELPATTPGALRAFVAQSFNQGARDFRVVRRGEEVIAFLTSTRLPGDTPLRHFRIGVHTAFRRRGLGTRLLEEVLAQEAALAGREPVSSARAVVQCNSQGSWTAGNAFLMRHGFEVARTELLQRRALAELPIVAAPPGVSIRLGQLRDDAAWSRLHEVAYAGRDDVPKVTPEDCEAARRAPGHVLVVAERDGAVLGFARGLELEPGEGLVDDVVVDPAARGQGIGGALVSALLEALARGGATTASLNVVAHERGAVALYCRLGFVEYDRMLLFRRTLTDPES